MCSHAAFPFPSQRVCAGPPLSLVLHWSLTSSYNDGSTSTSGDSKCRINLYFAVIVGFTFINRILLVSEQPSRRIGADTEVAHLWLWASSPERRAHWRLPTGCCYVRRCRKQVWFAPPQVQIIRHCNSKGSSYEALSCGLVERHSAPSKGKIIHQVPSSTNAVLIRHPPAWIFITLFIYFYYYIWLCISVQACNTVNDNVCN